ncbi:LexA family transcriptional regulator [Paenibacillus apiarius]|uniref:LexA family transcriptional regulator n=1 Tax=Paenibacillus apiarius TaxID=46240 RepID=UPI003B3B3560
MNYYELLRKYISDSNLTLKEIAEKLKAYNYNVTKSYISQLQNGKTGNPAQDELNRALAEITGGDVEKLLLAAVIEKAPLEIKEKFKRLEMLKSLKEEYCGALVVKEVGPQYGDNKEERFQSVPVLGSIAAGQPLDRIEYREDVVFVDRSITRGRETFALRVNGDSMIGDHISDGDVVICVSQEEVAPSDIAVVAVESDKATLKRVKCQSDMCMLMPSNPAMQPILISSSQVSILGKVIEVRRTL